MELELCYTVDGSIACWGGEMHLKDSLLGACYK